MSIMQGELQASRITQGEQGCLRAEGEQMVKFYNGRKLVKTVITNNTARVINDMMNSDIEWTRYKIF
jgi:hypothetical protein